MNHSIYVGSFAALEKRWSELIAELQQNDPLLEVNVLVGSNILASYLKRRLAQGGRVVANVRFYNFLDLVSRLAAAWESEPAKPPLPRLGAFLILKSLLASHCPKAYEPVSNYAGFQGALLDTFRDLRDAGITPRELDRGVQENNKNADRRRNLLALASMYRRFREVVAGFHDVDDDFRSAIAAASRAAQCLKSPRLIVYGIYDVTGQQSQLLTVLKDYLEMIYFIPFVDEDVSDFARPFLMKCVKELGAESISVEEEPRADSLGRLADRKFGLGRGALWSKEKKSLAADGSFALVSAPGESRAAVEIVREIFRAIQDGIIRGFHEAAVILPQPETDLPILTEMFRLRGVPYFVQGGVSFAERPLSQAVLALCGLESEGYAREAILSTMELVAASLPDDLVSAWDVQSWRALTNDPRLLAGLDSWDRGTESLVMEAMQDLKRTEESPAESVDEDEVGGPVSSSGGAEKRLETAKSLRSAWQMVRSVAANWPARLSWQQWAEFLNQRLEPLLGASRDWGFFSTVLDEIAALQELSRIPDPGPVFSGQEQVSADIMKDALRQSIRSLSYPTGRFQRDGVNILSPSAARGLRFPLVIVAGLEEGRFPAKLRQDPLLLDSERQWFKELPLKSRRIEEEKLLFDMTARSAIRRLVLLTSRLDEASDRERIPSQFFLQAAAAIKGNLISLRDLNPEFIPGFRSVSLDNPSPACNEPAVDEGEIRLRLIVSERGSARDALEALARMEPLRLAGPLAYDRARWNRRLTEFDGRLNDPALIQWVARKMGASAGQVSASRLEEYARCPYLFYLKRVMGLETWEETEVGEGLNPLERGKTVHSILEHFLADLGSEKLITLPVEDLWPSLESISRAHLEKVRPAGIPELLWEIERDGLLAVLREWLRFEKSRLGDDLHAVRLEQAFGELSPSEQLPSFRLEAGRHIFEFRGRIDRVDLSRDGKRARVIDYKVGILPASMNSKTKTPLMSGERIQIAVYREALGVLEGFENVEIVEGEYLYLQPRDARIAVCSYTNEELLEATKKLPLILEIMGDGIEKGVFFAKTRGVVRPAGHCEFCGFLPICGKDRMQREERKADDPEVHNFLRILEIY